MLWLIISVLAVGVFGVVLWFIRELFRRITENWI